MRAKITKEKKIIPTYVPGNPLDLPMFFEKRPYQGASGRLYPLPFTDGISDVKRDVAYDVYTLENEYVMTQVLPEIGGKILRGYDKTDSYDFIYYNEVVKPAQVGLAGPWISGGIEFNYPQHHRPTTFLPAEAVSEETDGSVTVWTGEVEPFGRMKGMAGITLDEGRSYIKAKIKLYNRTPEPQVFMWWANLAVPANENYKTIFPPDVEWVNDHDRRCVMSWPIAKSIYRTARPFDYGEGTDISRYDSVKVPSSFLVSQGQSDMDFVAGYDEGKKMGIVTVADHHIAPGKKMWHWGKGDFGDMWCSNLTDENGPYIELMTGVYTDNQPDFTWIAPYESREFEQYWYPIRGIGDVKNATIDAALNLELRDNRLFFGFNVTGVFENATVALSRGKGGKAIFREAVDMEPRAAYAKEIDLPAGVAFEDLHLSLASNDGRILVEYTPYVRGQKQPITPRKPVARPEEIETVEELYLNGLHLEQYKQHNYDARDYYLEALRRDETDARCNTAMARLSYKNGQFEACVAYADAAIRKLTLRNMHPCDTEAFYFKGLALKALGENKSAYDVLSMAGWDYRFRSAAQFELALLDCLQGDYAAALEKADASLAGNTGHHKARCIKALALRGLGRAEEAHTLLCDVKRADPLDMFARFLLLSDGESAEAFNALFGQKNENYLDVAYDCIGGGFYEDALAVLDTAESDYPLFDYVRAYCYGKLGQTEDVVRFLERAAAQDSGYCFPSRIGDIAVLHYAMENAPSDANAPYYLGCLYYDKFAYDTAIALWENCIGIDPAHPKAFRCLALAYADKKRDYLSAKQCMEQAMRCKPDDARLLYEYEQLLRVMNYSPVKRLAVYEEHEELADRRDDCCLDWMMLCCLVGNYEQAIAMAKARRFHVYEGGEGKLTKQHAWMHVLYGNALAERGDLEAAEKAYRDGIDVPKSYGEAKTFFNQEAHIYYYFGLLSEKQGQNEAAAEAFRKAAEYKAAVSEISLFRALALRKLNCFSEAKAVLDEMAETANGLLANADRYTYYGVGSPCPTPFDTDIVKHNRLEGYVLKAYALLGMGLFADADACMTQACALDPYDFRAYAYGKIRSSVIG